MHIDSVVAEVRKAREELAREAGNDLEQFLENLRLAQEKYKERLVDRVPKGKEEVIQRVERKPEW